MAEKKLSRQITVGRDPLTGKRIRKRVYATSKTGLVQAEREMIRKYAVKLDPKKCTYKQYEDRWFKVYCSKLAPSTIAGYRSPLRKLKHLYDAQISKITRPDIQDIINDNWHHPPTCKRLCYLLNCIWESAVFDGIVEKNIMEGIKKPKEIKIKRRPLTKEELEGVKNADLNEMERFLVDVLYQFGLRPGEAYALDHTSFDKKNRVLHINKALSHDKEKPYIKSTKTGVSRDLPVPDSFWEKIPPRKYLYFFTDADGNLLTKTEMYDYGVRIINKINEAMGGTKDMRATNMTLYYFRHHKASTLVYVQGVSTLAKAQYMGHSVEQFIKTYAHIMEEYEAEDALRKAM